MPAPIRFPSLPAGIYTIDVSTKLAYKTPEARQVQIPAGQTITLPALTLTRDARLRGTLSWTENGTRYAATTLYGEVSGTLVSVDGAVLSNGVSREVAFAIPVRPIPGQAVPVFTGSGTYALGEQEWTFGKYVRTSGADAASWYTPGTGTRTGQVTITQYDPAAFTLAGTFAFTAQPFANATGAPRDVTLTDGTFSLTY